MTIIAFIAATITVGVPAVVLLGISGYSFDMRKGQRRKARDGRAGGRRAEDRLQTA